MGTTQEIFQCMQACLPGIHLRTLEENRGVFHIREAVSKFTNGSTKTLYSWDSTASYRRVAIEDGTETVIQSNTSFEEMMQIFISSDEKMVLMLFDPWDELQRANYARALKLALFHARTKQKTIIIVGRDWTVPPEIQDQITLIELKLPTIKEIEALIKRNAESQKDKMSKVIFDEASIPAFARACVGLSMDEVRTVIALSIIRNNGIDKDAIKMALDEKKQIVSRSGILQYEDSVRKLDDVGGLQYLKEWITKRKVLFSEAAKQYGLQAPKGVLVVGVPGTGKSLCAKAIASEWKCPLVRLDAGKIFSKFVGDSESNLRQAIRTAEAVAPCVVLVDEIEKAFSSGGGNLDGGTSSRVFGALLTWLQDKQADVFVVATANDISKLPPELLRRGRFDAIFAVDLPDIQSRKDIFNIYLNKVKHEVKDTGIHATESSGYTGAEIEAIVQDAMVEAFNDNARPVTEQDLITAIKKTVPLSKTMGEQIKIIREWIRQGRAMQAGKSLDSDKTQSNEIVIVN